MKDPWYKFLLITLGILLTLTITESFAKEADGVVAIKGSTVSTLITYSDQQGYRFQLDAFWLDKNQNLPKEQFNLFIPKLGTKITARRSNYSINPQGNFVWLGVIKNKPGSQIAFHIKEQKITGTLTIDNRLLHFTTNNNGELTYQERTALLNNISEQDIPDELPTQKQSVSQSNQSTTYSSNIKNKQSISGFTTNNEIKVLIYYPVSALEAYPNLPELIELDLAQANLALKNNNIAASFILAKLLPIDIRDTSSVLSEMQARLGVFSNLDKVRTKYQADLVHFYVTDFIRVNGKSFCGYANYAASTDGNVFPHNALGVTSTHCFGNLTFVHELGHNLGANHDRFMLNGGDPTSSNYGYVNTQELVRTIMSYPDECNELEVSCQRIPYFSTPDVIYQDITIGINNKQSNAADNSAMLQMSIPSVANFAGLESPTGLTASNDNLDEISISWDPYPGADAYTLYAMKGLREIDGHTSCLTNFFSITTAYDLRDNFFSMPRVDKGEAYCFWVRAKNSTLLHGAQLSPDSAMDIGQRANDTNELPHIVDQFITDGNDLVTIKLDMPQELELSTINALIESSEFSVSADVEILTSTDSSLILQVNNPARENGNVRLILWNETSSEAFNVHFSGFESETPQISSINSAQLMPEEVFTTEFTVIGNSLLGALNVHAYSDNHQLIKPEYILLEATEIAGNYSLRIARDNIVPGVVTIAIVATDGELYSTQSFNIEVTRDKYRAPIIQDVTYEVAPDEPLIRIFPAFDLDNDTLLYNVIQQPEHGELTMRKAGAFMYEANENFQTDSFQFTVTDPYAGESRIATIRLVSPELTYVPTTQQIVASHGNVILLNHEGNVWSWGQNLVNNAGLGRDGIATWSPQPTPLTKIADIAANNFNYYIKQDGSLWFMGQSYYETEYIYVDTLTQIGHESDWLKIECYARRNECMLLKKDGSVWKMFEFLNDSVIAQDGTATVEHFFSQYNALSQWKEVALNDSGGALTNQQGELWSWTSDAQKPQGRAIDITALSHVDTLTNVSQLYLSEQTGFVLADEQMFGWGQGLQNLISSSSDDNLVELITNSAWQAITSDGNAYAKIEDGRLSTWATDSVFNFSSADNLARGDSPDLIVADIATDNEWLQVFMPQNNLMFALDSTGQLWAAGAIYKKIGDRPPYAFVYSGGPELGIGEVEEVSNELSVLSSLPTNIMGAGDLDADLIRDYIDSDDDNDGIPDVMDDKPYDTDNDGQDNVIDTDDDNDGVADIDDIYPLDATKASDPVTPTPSTKSSGGSLDWISLCLLIIGGIRLRPDIKRKHYT